MVPGSNTGCCFQKNRMLATCLTARASIRGGGGSWLFRTRLEQEPHLAPEGAGRAPTTGTSSCGCVLFLLPPDRALQAGDTGSGKEPERRCRIQVGGGDLLQLHGQGVPWAGHPADAHNLTVLASRPSSVTLSLVSRGVAIGQRALRGCSAGGREPLPSGGKSQALSTWLQPCAWKSDQSWVQVPTLPLWAQHSHVKWGMVAVITMGNTHGTCCMPVAQTELCTHRPPSPAPVYMLKL